MKIRWEDFVVVLIMCLLILAVSLGGCASLPEKPRADVCGLYCQPDHEIGGICAPAEQSVTTENDLRYKVLLQSIYDEDGVYFKPIEEMHGYICMSPEHWNNVVQYIANLKKIIIRNCLKSSSNSSDNLFKMLDNKL